MLATVSLKLGTLDYAILLGYLGSVLVIGWFIQRFTKTSGDFFLAGRSIPAWAAALAFISANCGAAEVVGIAACGLVFSTTLSATNTSGLPTPCKASQWRL